MGNEVNMNTDYTNSMISISNIGSGMEATEIYLLVIFNRFHKTESQ